MPASCSSATASRAMRGVCSAGFATTLLPAISAAVTWPRKIASGKFHGEIATKTPRPRRRAHCSRRSGPASRPRCRTAFGPARHSSGRSRRPRALPRARRRASCRPRAASSAMKCALRLSSRCAACSSAAARVAAGVRLQAAKPARAAAIAAPRLLGRCVGDRLEVGASAALTSAEQPVERARARRIRSPRELCRSGANRSRGSGILA